jgi:hypothetical protein
LVIVDWMLSSIVVTYINADVVPTYCRLLMISLFIWTYTYINSVIFSISIWNSVKIFYIYVGVEIILWDIVGIYYYSFEFLWFLICCILLECFSCFLSLLFSAINLLISWISEQIYLQSLPLFWWNVPFIELT